MDKHTYLNNANSAYVDDLYDQYQTDPDSVDVSWRKFFEGFEFASNGSVSKSGRSSSLTEKEISVMKLINSFRARGHLISKTNPVRQRREHKADLALSYFGLSEDDFGTTFEAGKQLGLKDATLKDILDHLEKTYCSSIGVEFMYCRDEKLRQWMYEEMETNGNTPNFSKEEKIYILKKINQSVSFESFLQKKYVGQKRFSLEGLEAIIPSLDTAIREGAKLGAKEFVIGMAHRGRLNVLVNIFGKAYEAIFSEFEHSDIPENVYGDGDVKYHLGHSSDITTEDGLDVHLSLLPNPSHLEAVNPVVQGVVRAKSADFYHGDIRQIVPILIHGDAAYAGQGVNYEVINMSKLDGYSTGGTVHIILNNQIGFTTNYKEARTSVYCTDLAKVVESPVFHVNADNPEHVVHAVRMAIKIRQKFKIDVFVDILGYRKYGHNEGDEPRFTQPILYKTIKSHKNVYEIYLEQLLNEKVVTQAGAEEIAGALRDFMQNKLEYVKEEKPKQRIHYLQRHWEGLRVSTDADFESSIDTSFESTKLDQVASALTTEPENFSLFPKMKKLLNFRKKLYFDDKKVDWGLAELLAYGSLLLDGFPIRISGQDCQRGTFSHRHAVIKDLETENPYIPLQNIDENQDH
ncbi:MAG: 2-oxoglutarate dehydrogenase E1 component, partial [Candidatus Marinamargulisbacteria bacterium]